MAWVQVTHNILPNQTVLIPVNTELVQYARPRIQGDPIGTTILKLSDGSELPITQTVGWWYDTVLKAESGGQ